MPDAARASSMGRAAGTWRRRAPGASSPARRARRSRRCSRSRRRAGVELLARVGDRLAGLAQVLDVVQRVVQAEDLDPALGGGSDEAPDEVAADGARADEKPAAQRHRERRLRACVERPDPLPGALDAAAHRAVEDAAAGDLEVGEPGAVQNLGEVEQLRGRNPPSKRLLAKQADGCINERWHVRGSLAPPSGARH